jgi:uncharacterized membrane protein
MELKTCLAVLAVVGVAFYIWDLRRLRQRRRVDAAIRRVRGL